MNNTNTILSQFAQIKEIKNKTTWLQGVGAHVGKPAGELIVGDVMVWNGGGTSTVAKIIRETAKMIVIEEVYESKSYERKMKKDRIVAIDGMGCFNVTKEQLAMV